MNATQTSAAGLNGTALPAAPPLLDGLPLRAAGRWLRVFWPLASLLLAGALFFAQPIRASIASTPHPELVYAIFVVAAVAAVLLAILLSTIIRERGYLETLEAAGEDLRQDLMFRRPGEENLSVYYRLLAQTREEPLLERQRMLEHELENAEADLFSRLALPNLLSGSLVGLGLVGTFIGLLGTLQELSGVFAALGGAGSGNTASMFATMIQKLQGPMEGMGTAFVASLYGLLGSLVIGLTATSVRRAAEQLFNGVRSFATQQLHADSGVALSAAARPKTAYEQVFPMTLLAGNDKLRMSIERWREEFGKQVGSFEDVASRLGTQLAEAVQSIASETQRSLERVAEQREIDAKIVARLDSATADLNSRLDALRSELDARRAAESRSPMQWLVLTGAIAGLIAMLGVAFLSGRVSAPAPRGAVKVVEKRVPVVRATVSEAPKLLEVTVGPGDSLTRIARRKGVPLEALRAANPQLTNPDRLTVGETLALPR